MGPGLPSNYGFIYAEVSNCLTTAAGTAKAAALLLTLIFVLFWLKPGFVPTEYAEWVHDVHDCS